VSAAGAPRRGAATHGRALLWIRMSKCGKRPCAAPGAHSVMTLPRVAAAV